MVNLLCRLSVGLMAMLAAAEGSIASEDAEDTFHFGQIEYEISCLPCHGVDGRGDGPAADRLDPTPTDLTVITKSNGGVFPTKRLELMIDGRDLLAAHGPRAMPIWGERYRVPVIEGENREDIEAEARQRIDALLLYIEAIQVE